MNTRSAPRPSPLTASGKSWRACRKWSIQTWKELSGRGAGSAPAVGAGRGGRGNLDYLNKEISKYISHVIVYENNEKDSAQISAFFRVSGNLSASATTP